MQVIEDNPQETTQADIVVGIPSYNEADRIAFPTQRADEGLRQFFADRSAVILNCDNNSPDGTREAFLGAPTQTPKIYLSTPDNIRGKGYNIRNLIRKAVDLSAKAVIVLDADLKSITPRWIRNLGEPIFEDSHYVAPLYVRHKYEGPVTNNIAYPLTRALYGRRIRQPIGGEFGFSGEMARKFAETEEWDEAVLNFGIDVWMSTTAMRSGVEMTQSFMGGPRIHEIKDTAAGTAQIFRNVVGTIFQLMRGHETFWREVKWSKPTAIFGFGLGEIEVPPPVKVDADALWNEFDVGVRSQADMYTAILKPECHEKLLEVAGLPREAFEFPTVLWAQVIYDFAWAYKNQVFPHEDLLTGLMPLFYGKTLSFVLETEAMNTHQVEEIIEEQCLQFEKTKPYLLERWFSG